MLKTSFDTAMKSRLKTIAKSRLVLKCPKHTRYNPAEGRGAIKGILSGLSRGIGGV